MESKVASFGSTVKVPIVQELAKEKMASVPSRYIRHLHRRDHLPSSLTQIPVIDLHNLFDPDSMDSELDKLHSACKEWGFFQLINHGVKPSVIDTIKLEIQEFFNLPLEEKIKFCQEAGDVEGYGQTFVVSQEQKLDWGDIFYVVTLPTYLRKPHLIPKLPSKFGDAIKAYAEELLGLAARIASAMLIVS